jgi:CheY-like chemotaxis protein
VLLHLLHQSSGVALGNVNGSLCWSWRSPRNRQEYPDSSLFCLTYHAAGTNIPDSHKTGARTLCAMKQSGVLLLVEDNEIDVLFFRRAISKSGVTLPLQVVSDGLEAIAYLTGTGSYADRSRFPAPSLVLLDLKLPRKSGLEVLQWAQGEPSLRDLRIVVMSTSSEPSDLKSAYQLGASLYIVKFSDLRNLVSLVQAIAKHWNDLGDVQKHLSAFGTPRPTTSSRNETF